MSLKCLLSHQKSIECVQSKIAKGMDILKMIVNFISNIKSWMCIFNEKCSIMLVYLSVLGPAYLLTLSHSPYKWTLSSNYRMRGEDLAINSFLGLNEALNSWKIYYSNASFYEYHFFWLRHDLSLLFFNVHSLTFICSHTYTWKRNKFL